MVIAEVTLVPVGTGGPSVSPYVKAAFDALEDSGLKCTLDPMGTTIEGDSAEEVFAALASAREAVFEEGVERVYMVLKMDERRDKNRSAGDMARSVKGE
jgi:uncharacterized protein (TIGR00106 family)